MKQIFKRTWYVKEGKNIVPGPGRKTKITVVDDDRAARDYCEAANSELPDYNPLSMKYEFEEA